MIPYIFALRQYAKFWNYFKLKMNRLVFCMFASKSKVKQSKVTLFTLGNRFSSKLISNLAEHPHIIIVTGPSTLPGWALNSGPLSFEAIALLTELTRPDLNIYHRSSSIFRSELL